MGYWSIFRSVDAGECRLTVAMSPDNAADAVAGVLTEPGRVECQVVGDTEVHVTTRRHTPAWAFAFPPLLLFVRKDRKALVTVGADGTGTVLTVTGSIDTRAMDRLRAIRSAPYATV
jgi:hypothetical protein